MKLTNIFTTHLAVSRAVFCARVHAAERPHVVVILVDDMMAIYAAMIDTMDRSVGMLVDGLRQRGPRLFHLKFEISNTRFEIRSAGRCP